LLPVDSGETAAARNVPFARFEVSREQELPAVMAASGLSVDDVSEVVLTHHHGDHVEGLVHLRARARINEVELRFAGAGFSRLMRRVLRQPLPPDSPPSLCRSTTGPSAPSPAARPSAGTGASSPSARPGTPRGTSR